MTQLFGNIPKDPMEWFRTSQALARAPGLLGVSPKSTPPIVEPKPKIARRRLRTFPYLAWVNPHPPQKRTR
jgi:hypothetical protein